MTANQYWAKFHPEKSTKAIRLLSLIKKLNLAQDRICDKMDASSKPEFEILYSRYYQLVDIEYNCRAQRTAILRHEDQYCNELVGISA
jgi:hypothetical protein